MCVPLARQGFYGRGGEVANPPDDLRVRKLGKLFDIIDRNDTGSVGVEDYEALGQRLADAAGSHSNAPNADEVRETFKQIWDEFQKSADRDGDGRVSKQEFIDSVFLPMTKSPARLTQFINLTCNLLFGLADADRDGQITKEEHIRFGQEVFGVSSSDAETSFSNLAPSGQNSLDLPAYVVAYTEFLTSPSPTAAGNSLFGKVI